MSAWYQRAVRWCQLLFVWPRQLADEITVHSRFTRRAAARWHSSLHRGSPVTCAATPAVLRSLAGIGCALLLCCLARTARAYEDQWTLAAGAGYAPAATDRGLEHGVLVDASASAGLSATWALRGRLSYGIHPRDPAQHAAIAAAELLYVVDVLELVPYAGAGAGGVLRVREGDTHLSPAVHLVLGVDYLLSRSIALELDARAHLLLDVLPSDPVYAAVTVGVVWLLDP